MNGKINPEWSIVYGSNGKPVGSIAFRGRSYHYIDESKKLAAEFLTKVTKQTKGESVSKKQTEERVNMVLLAGIVQVSKVSEDSVWFTLDVGQTQWVPCTAKEPELQEKLKGIYRGDFVQLRAILHPWSKKTGETWTRGMEVLITEVKTLVKGNGAAPKENSANALPF